MNNCEQNQAGRIIKPPTPIPTPLASPSVFLAGSIEMGKAIDWQAELGESLAHEGWTVLNPRRSDWDSSWEQSIDNPQFFGQVTWEMSGLESVDVILIYFAPETKSPISLLELGLHAASRRCIVVCPDGFWRKGNVDIVCYKHRTVLVPDLQRARQALAFRMGTIKAKRI